MHKEEHKVDKSKYPSGPWMDEPDKLNWKDPSTGLSCMIVRNLSGALCGYVGVDTTHPYYGKNYDDVPVNCHGGLTYGRKCNGVICHIPEQGDTDDVFWFGFDCAHYNDYVPCMSEISHLLQSDMKEYRDLNYVKNEVTQLAKQLYDLR